MRKTNPSYEELQEKVFNLMPEIIQNTSDLSSGQIRLISKLYWMSLIDIVFLIIKAIQNKNNKHLILDVGCGIGHISKILSNFDFEVVGTDINSNDLWKKINADNLQFIQSDALYLPFHEKTFNCIGAFAVIEHVKDCSSFLYELNRALKKGGMLIISQLPSIFGLTELPTRILTKSSHEKYYTKAEILSLLKNNGFQLINISYDHFLPQYLPTPLLNKIWNSYTKVLYKIDNILSFSRFSHSFNIISQKVVDRNRKKISQTIENV